MFKTIYLDIKRPLEQNASLFAKKSLNLANKFKVKSIDRITTFYEIVQNSANDRMLYVASATISIAEIPFRALACLGLTISSLFHGDPHFYAYFLGLDKNKVKKCEDLFNTSKTHDLPVYYEGYVHAVQSIESYYVDKKFSDKIDLKILQNLIETLKNCIDNKKAYTTDFDTQRDHPIEVRFFYAVYNRKLSEIIEKKLIKINPYPEKSKKYKQWELSRSLIGKPPPWDKNYDLWTLYAMNCTYLYLSNALKLDVKNKGKNNNLLLHFTYSKDLENELKIRTFS